MNYVQFHVGDWDSSTRLLTPLEKGIYIDLLMLYYSTERPILRSYFDRITRGYTEDERKAFDYVVSQYFEEQDDGFHNARCDEEIAKAAEKSEKARKSIQARWNKAAKGHASSVSDTWRKPDESTDAIRTNNERNTDVLLTNNQEPITNINKVGGAFSEKVADAHEPPPPSDFCDEIPEEPFPEDWGALEPLPPPETKPAKKEKRGTRLDVQTLPDEWGAFVKERAPDLDPDLVFEEFKNYWVSQPGQKGVKLDWFATFRNNVISMPDGKRRALSRKHTSFEHVNYHEGINPDGSF